MHEALILTLGNGPARPFGVLAPPPLPVGAAALPCLCCVHTLPAVVLHAYRRAENNTAQARQMVVTRKHWVEQVIETVIKVATNTLSRQQKTRRNRSDSPLSHQPYHTRNTTRKNNTWTD
jgi:hypothetical protein